MSIINTNPTAEICFAVVRSKKTGHLFSVSNMGTKYYPYDPNEEMLDNQRKPINYPQDKWSGSQLKDGRKWGAYRHILPFQNYEVVEYSPLPDYLVKEFDNIGSPLRKTY